MRLEHGSPQSMLRTKGVACEGVDEVTWLDRLNTRKKGKGRKALQGFLQMQQRNGVATGRKNTVKQGCLVCLGFLFKFFQKRETTVCLSGVWVGKPLM